MSHVLHPIYQENGGVIYNRERLPLPPREGLTTIKLNEYKDVPEEPVFDPKVHLDLQMPEYVRVLETFEKSNTFPKINKTGGSDFAYSSPFQVMIFNDVLKNEHPTRIFLNVNFRRLQKVNLFQ